MVYDKDLVAGKLRRWAKYLNEYRLPQWDEIPDFGLYMEQVLALLCQYLDYLPPELKEEQFITAAAINNYVRRHLMPEPIKKRYYRVHIVYLIMICTLKQSLSISTMQTILPTGIPEEQVHRIYDAYVLRHRLSAEYFVDQVCICAAGILDHEVESEFSVNTAEELILSSAVVGGFAKLLAEKLLLLSKHQQEAIDAAESGEKTVIPFPKEQ